MEDQRSLIEKIRARLDLELPGREAQFKMAPDIRLKNQYERYRNAAVLVLLYPVGNRLHFVLMKRTEYEGAHSKQVSLPGGLYEDGDGDLSVTALREAREETGVDEGKIEILGSLSRLEIPVSGFEVTPYIGYYPEKPEFVSEPSEVSYLIEVSLSDLFSEDNIQYDTRNILNNMVKVPYFSLGGEKVWGATAMMLSEFLEVMKELKD